MIDYTIVMILRNVHSLVNDDNVEVLLASRKINRLSTRNRILFATRAIT